MVSKCILGNTRKISRKTQTFKAGKQWFLLQQKEHNQDQQPKTGTFMFIIMGNRKYLVSTLAKYVHRTAEQKTPQMEHGLYNLKPKGLGSQS